MAGALLAVYTKGMTMRLHSDKIVWDDIAKACYAAGMRGVSHSTTEHGSRIRDRAFEVKLTGNSPRRPNGGVRPGTDDHAATWDEWGMFLAYLFKIDPNMVAGDSGRPAYDGAENFHAATGGRFETLTADDQHRSHKWENIGAHLFECRCGATVDYSFMWNKRER